MFRKLEFSSLIIWSVFFVILPLPLILSLLTEIHTLGSQQQLSIYSGTIAYTWMLLAVFLGTRPHWLDRLVGLPNIYQLHGILATAALLLAWLHKFSSHAGGLIKQTGDLALIILTIILIYSFLLLSNWLTAHSIIFKALRHSFEKVFKHEFTLWTHRLNLLAIALIFIHVQLIGFVTRITPFMILFDSYSLVTLLIYLKFKLNWYRSDQAELTVFQNKQISARICELTLDGRQLAKLQLLPGDFIFLAFPKIKELHEPHPFSIVALPVDTGKLKLAIRADGDFTTALAKVKAGTQVKVTGGYGRYQHFIDEQPSQANLVIITGGIGVTPSFSVIKHNLSHQIYFFYTTHHVSELLYLDQLKQWNQLNNFHGYWQKGRFSDNFVVEHLPVDWKKATLFLLSGPTPLINHWQAFLLKQQVKPTCIFKENFSW
ncbi:FAD-binding oxidoreductase [Liquorilactobacillus vini]|uniref:Ferric reductase n=1 Tax=Liquorilactobacillus vini DSM 20605 TaxID=1133569 RepID=A0A0R2BU83_9LACO|nr:FAD-binding oxidoreductase [Liquorilactobacillus vini]KRM82945.1 ferric reductase [Liquorilactobacillus vini DSM 20605]